MINVCARCGMYRADKIIDQEQSIAICPQCKHAHPFQFLPILFVCGASGTGKSTICQQLTGSFSEAILLEGDLLWHPAFNQPQNSYRDFFEIWLRMAKNITQSGRSVVIFGAGSTPENVEPCVERRYFSKACYLALTCHADTLRDRLQQRPRWRESSHAEFVEQQQAFNQHLKELATEPSADIDALDTTSASIEETLKDVAIWIRSHLA